MEKSVDTPLNVATTETSQISQDFHWTPEDTSSCPVDEISTDLELLRLLDNQEGAEDDILQHEDVEQQDRDLSAEERIFLEEFPILKRELKVAIRKFHALADEIDRTHKTFTKTNVVTGSVSVVSGVMSILGLALAPATAGGSLALSAAGSSLGTVAGATSILTGILEHFHNKRVRAEVSGEAPTRAQEVEEAVDRASLLLAAQKMCDYGNNINDIQKNIRAFHVARAHPRLARAAKRLLRSGHVSARRSRQVQRAFEGTPLAMKENARLLGGAMAGLSLGMDLKSLLQDWRQLKEGAKTELAEELRARARALEAQLAGLRQLHGGLQQKQQLLQEKAPQDSFSEEATGTLPQPPAKHGATGPQVPAVSG